VNLGREIDLSMVSSTIGAFLGELLLAGTLFVEIDRWLPAFEQRGTGNDASTGAWVIIPIVLGLAALGGLLAATIAAAVAGSLGWARPSVPFGAAALGLATAGLLFWLMLQPRAVTTVVVGLAMLVWIAGTALLAGRLAALSYWLAPVLASVVLLCAAIVSGVLRASVQRYDDVTTAFAAGLAKDDSTVLDRLTVDSNQIDLVLPLAVIDHPRREVIARLIASPRESRCLTALRQAIAGAQPAPVEDGGDCDEAVMMFAATHRLNMAMETVATRWPTMVASVLKTLLARGDQDSAASLLEGAHRLDDQQRLVPNAYTDDLLEVLEEHLDWALEHADPDVLLVFAVGNERHWKQVPMLLDKGASASRPIVCGTTPLAALITHGSYRENLSLLIGRGADPNRVARGYCLPGGKPSEIEGTAIDLFAGAMLPDWDEYRSAPFLRALIALGADPKRARPESLALLRQRGADYAAALSGKPAADE
jgi:hypothetical protein